MVTLAQPKVVEKEQDQQEQEMVAWEDGDITNTETGAHIGSIDVEQDFLGLLFQGVSIFHNGHWYGMKVDQRYKSEGENSATAAG